MLTNTPDILRERLVAAQAREREARASAAKIRREMAALDRRRETQRLCVLGRAWEVWGARDERFRAAAIRVLGDYVTRETDLGVLRGTPWEVQPPAPVTAPASEQGGDRGE